MALSIPANSFGLFSTTIFICSSFHSFSRNIPIMISRNATTKSSTFSEKNEMHITAPRNAATASTMPKPQFLRRLRFFLTLSPPIVFLTYYIRKGVIRLQINFNFSRIVTARLQYNYSYVIIVDMRCRVCYTELQKTNERQRLVFLGQKPSKP